MKPDVTDEITLATWDRNRGEVQVRLRLARYNGQPYMDLRQWVRGTDGDYHPTRKGTSVRIAEAAELAAALERGLDRVGDEVDR